MVSIVWKQSYEISCLMASLSPLFYRILDKKSDFNILTAILGLVAQAKSACGGDEVALAFDAISCGFRALGFRLVAANYCLAGAYYRLVGANYGLAAANETMARI